MDTIPNLNCVNILGSEGVVILPKWRSGFTKIPRRIDLERGRIGLNTALLENTPGELIIDKEKVMIEASERSLKTKSLFDKKDLEK